ncbi:hypothetical protein V6N11_055745 [Hibiscus sabdariffa]|uniref:Uncharacterized protein n=2 Tax=Hibiscus sabdariffa TaxID=183260 RepID=A0ABR2ACD3_9ROSI
MEFQVSLFQVLITFFLVLFMTIRISKARNSAPKLIPGPWKLPLIGNLHQLVGSDLPHRTLRDLANKHGPIMHLQLGQVPTVVVSSPEIAMEIMKTLDLVFAYRPLLVVSMITTYGCTDIAFSPLGNYWRQLRKICNEELLSAARVDSFRSIREEEVLNLVETIKTNEGLHVNLSGKVSAMTYAITARAAFGQKCQDQDAFIGTISEETKVNSGFFISEFFPSLQFLDIISGLKHRVEKIHGEADRILGNIVNDHKESRSKIRREDVGKEDLVDVLLRLQQDGQFPLTDDNIKAIIFDIFSGGSETSATVVDWAMAEMMRNPRVMANAQAEVREAFQGKGNVDETGIHQLKYLKCVIKETLRLHPVFPLLLPRESSRSCKVNGFEIPSKTRVMINAWAIGRDPNHWAEPEKFDPERFVNSSVDFTGTDFEFIPFGAGRRICPGMLFALPNVELPLAQLLFHFDWKLPSGMKEQDFDMTELFGMTVRRKNELVLVPSLCHASLTVA